MKFREWLLKNELKIPLGQLGSPVFIKKKRQKIPLPRYQSGSRIGIAGTKLDPGS